MKNQAYSPLRRVPSDRGSQEKIQSMTENNYMHDSIDKDNDVVNDRHIRDNRPLREKSTSSAKEIRAPAITGGTEINNGEERRIEE